MTRPDIDVFLPPIGGITIYVFGEAETLVRPVCTADLPGA